jgi:hypothetical protein
MHHVVVDNATVAVGVISNHSSVREDGVNRKVITVGFVLVLAFIIKSWLVSLSDHMIAPGEFGLCASIELSTRIAAPW